MKLEDLRLIESLDLQQMQLDEAGWGWWRRLFRSDPDDAPSGSGGIRTLDGYAPGMLPYGGNPYQPRRDPWGGVWPKRGDSPHHPPRGINPPRFPGHGYHPNHLNWYWDSSTGGWVRVNPPDPMPPGVRFPQPTTPGGTPGYSYPHHGPNGYPLSPDPPHDEMPVNPDTGEPWVNDPYTNNPYGDPPPWDADPPGSDGWPDQPPPSGKPGQGVDVDIVDSPGGPMVVPVNPMSTRPPGYGGGGGDAPDPRQAAPSALAPTAPTTPTMGSNPRMMDPRRMRFTR